MLCTHVDGLVELHVEVHLGDAVHVFLVDLEVAALEVLGHDSRARSLGDDGKATLGSPSEEDLGRGLVVLLSETLKDLVLHEGRSRLGDIHVELDEASGAEG